MKIVACRLNKAKEENETLFRNIVESEYEKYANDHPQKGLGLRKIIPYDSVFYLEIAVHRNLLTAVFEWFFENIPLVNDPVATIQYPYGDGIEMSVYKEEFMPHVRQIGKKLESNNLGNVMIRTYF